MTGRPVDVGADSHVRVNGGDVFRRPWVELRVNRFSEADVSTELFVCRASHGAHVTAGGDDRKVIVNK